MKWLEIFKFEMAYRLKRPVTYIYFLLVFVVSLITLSTNIVHQLGAENLVKPNAPIIIATTMATLSALFMVITSAVMGVPILRDSEHNTVSLIFTKPISKLDYLAGRFLGSFIILIFIFCGCLFGAMLSPFMPWSSADLLTFNLGHYLQPFILIVFTNLFFTSALFFMSGALSKRTLVVYTQAIMLLALYEMMDGIANDIETKEFAALIDPLLLHSILIETQYWTIFEQNSLVLPISGGILLNRVIWLGVGVLALFITYLGFSFNVVPTTIIKKRAKPERSDLKAPRLKPPHVKQVLCGKNYVIQTLNQAYFYFKMVIKDLPFLAILVTAMIMLFMVSLDMGQEYGDANTFPTTSTVIEAIDGFNLFLVIILIFYSGELVWKERAVQVNQIHDAMPIPDIMSLFSKFLSLVGVLMVLILLLIASGVLIQLSRGYLNIDLGLYFSSLYTGTLFRLVLLTILAFFIQVVVNHKFLGFALMIFFVVTTLAMKSLGVEHGMFHYGKSYLGLYSEMNGFGHYIPGFVWFNIYWFGLAIVLLGISALFGVRGSEALMKLRIKEASLRLGKSLRIFLLVGAMIFVVSGCYVYYNTNILNVYQSTTQQEGNKANYEKELKKFEWINQPTITGVDLQVDIFPKTRDYDAFGTFTLTNKTEESIHEIHLRLHRDHRIVMNELNFSTPSVLKQAYNQYRYYIYTLEVPMQPGNSLTMEFSTSFRTEGFVQDQSSNEVIFNGTFFSNSHFPLLGYDVDYELIEKEKRMKFDLPSRERMLSLDDPRGQKMALTASNNINFEIIVSTDTSQIAIAPGYLQKEWINGARRYFRYAMDMPIENQYAVISAEYRVLRDQVTIETDTVSKEVDLEIYYHPGHEYNIGRMMNGMKKSLTYYSNNFSPFQYRQMRIVEFPKYAKFAQSFPNTVPFSEGIGFVMNIEEEDADVPFYITAHELGHQWWGDQVLGARTQGGGMVVETLTQYSAAMVTRKEYSDEHLHQILLYELKRYLSGRKGEVIEEKPLALVEDQQYIHYGKGLINMFALQDYISEDSVNAALRRLAKDWRRVDEKYPTTYDIIGYFRNVTPDSLQYLITDLFEKIVLFENKVASGSYRKISKEEYEVELNVSARKFESDSLGTSTEVSFGQWIDVGVYSEGENGGDELVYLKKHRITGGSNTIKITVMKEPSKAGIDPLNKLIDRDPKDNVRELSEELVL